MHKTANEAVNSTAPDEKAFATLQAQLALKGHTVIKGPTGCDDYMVTRWGLSRYCQDWHALVAFAKQVGVQP